MSPQAINEMRSHLHEKYSSLTKCVERDGVLGKKKKH